MPPAEAVSAAVNVVEGAAVCDGPERPAGVRVAGHAGRVYLHLADASGTVVEVDAAGWRECPDPPARFVKPAGMLPLPVPARGGSVADLRRFVNLPDDDAFALAVARVDAALTPAGPYPVAVLGGEPGSCKSTASDVLKSLVDPFKAARRGGPKELRDLMVSARRQWVMTLDNLRTLPDWLSGGLCRLSTGGGFGIRRLFTDDDEELFEATRPAVLNGITDYADAPDLLDRALVFRLRRLPPGRRRTERAFWREFEAARPALLGAFLDRAAGGLRELPGVALTDPPRMADFAEWAVACERGAGGPVRFLAAYAGNRREAHELALDGSPVATAVVRYMADRAEWSGAPTDLLRALTPLAPAPRARDWPKGANRLTNVLRTLAPDLRRARGLDVDCDGRDGDRNRLVTVARMATPAADLGSCRPSRPSLPGQDGRDGRDDPSPDAGAGDPDTSFSFGAGA